MVATVEVVLSAHSPGAPPARRLAHGLTERQWLVLDGVAVVIASLATVFYLRDPRLGGGHSQPAGMALAVVASAPIAFRRSWPLQAFAVTTAATAALVSLGLSPLPLGAMLALVGYMVAARAPRRFSVPALVLGEVALVLALALATGTGRRGIGTEPVQVLLLLAVAWFVGDSVSVGRAYRSQQAEQERASEAERGRQAVRDERVRIARELHDIIAHSLAVITVQAGAGRRLMAKRPEQAATALESIEAAGRNAQDELRVVLGLLRDEGSGPAELGPAPGLEELGQLVETVRETGTPVELRTSGTDRQLPPALALSVYRVVQEALTNVVKHAPGTQANVFLSVSAREINIVVDNDGGARAERAPRKASRQPSRPSSEHGVVGMKERVAAFGGSLVAEPVPGQGFRVTARIPVPGTP